MQKFKMWMDGKWTEADSGKTFFTHNPANGEIIAEAPLAGKSDVDKAVAAARKAFPSWRRKTQEDRSSAVARIAAALREHKDELIRLEILEHGATARHAPIMLAFAIANLELAASAPEYTWAKSFRPLQAKALPKAPRIHYAT
jgi:acyl-CoA reductase-like NAD-dependent aldehyde dehydrogenase